MKGLRLRLLKLLAGDEFLVTQRASLFAAPYSYTHSQALPAQTPVTYVGSWWMQESK